MPEPRAQCAGCGAEQEFGRIRCTNCGKPLVFPKSFVCPDCGFESFNLNDVLERYCGRCHRFVDDLKSHRFPARRCLNCGHELDAADSLATPDAPRPSEGDVCVCIKCAEPMIFNADLSFRWPTPEERAEILAEPDTADTITAVRHAAYRNPAFSERTCDRCGKPYQGPAVYCSFECAVTDA